MKLMSRLAWLIVLGAVWLTVVGCDDPGMTVYLNDGAVIVGQLVSADFQKEELLIRTREGRDLVLRFNDIQRVDKGFPPRTR